MAQCKWCERSGWFLKLSPDGLCRNCIASVRRDVYSRGKLIQQVEKLLEATQDTELAAKQCDTIINNAREVLKYEERGIPTYTPLPSELIEEYSHRHDNILMRQQAERVAEALEVARFALAPHNAVNLIQGAIDQLNAATDILRELPWSTRIAAIINQKGGVGKTTSAISIGTGLAKLDKRVLLIDFDPQANLTDGCGIDENEVTAGIFELLKGTVSPDQVIVQRNGVSVIPATLLLTRIENEYRTAPDRYFLLRNALVNIKGYDYMIIDCPPSLGILTINALMTARDVYIPLLPEYFALKGIKKLLDTIEFVRRSGNSQLEIKGIIGTRYDRRKVHHREVIQKIRESMGDRLYHVIRENISIAEASSYGVPIFEYRPRSHGAEDYMNLCREILQYDGQATIEITER